VRVAVLRHHDQDDAGFVGEAFEASGATLSSHLYPDRSLPDLDGVGHVVVLGSLWSVYDEANVGHWVGPELAWLAEANDRGIGVLGICFGAQLLAAALGGRVEPSPRLEIGWTGVEPVVSAPGPHHRASSIDVPPSAVAPGPWMEFHGDRCVVPPGAVVIAESTLCVQAFTIGHCLAVQFHPEVDASQLQRWLDDGSRDTVVAAGLDPEELVARTRAEEAPARRRAADLVAAYLAASVR
jgi:GMP synthase-like glutamine amidotransferase